MSISTIKYHETFFSKPYPNPIIGKPTIESFYQLILDFRFNSQPVHSNLGRESHGHIGLVLTILQYVATQSQTPQYVLLTHPDVLAILQLPLVLLRQNWAESHRVTTFIPRS